MADSNPTDCVECSPSLPVDQDVQAERAVLAFLLNEHPAQLTIPEASRAINAVPGGFEAEDAVERAIRELDGAGLVHCYGGFAVPTRAALYFARLWGV
jgi:hypothetical protein